MLATIGCIAECIQAIRNAGVTSILDVLTFTDVDVSTMCKIIHKDGILFPLTAEMTFKLLVSEAQIRHQTHRDLEELYHCQQTDRPRDMEKST
jgi:hypothetical protein